jgi:hypothetical protein
MKSLDHLLDRFANMALHVLGQELEFLHCASIPVMWFTRDNATFDDLKLYDLLYSGPDASTVQLLLTYSVHFVRAHWEEATAEGEERPGPYERALQRELSLGWDAFNALKWKKGRRRYDRYLERPQVWRSLECPRVLASYAAWTAVSDLLAKLWGRGCCER